jgi:DNA primase
MRVDELLQEKRIEYKVSGRDFLVKCLNPEHADTHPSMRIDQVTGIFNCFSCGFRGNAFTHFGEAANFLDIRRQKLKTVIQETRSSSVGFKFPKGFIPYEGNWRQIKPETYKHFEAFLHHDRSFNGRVVFPIRDITGKVVAFNGRHMTMTETPKYLIYPPQAVLPLYPSAVNSIKGRVILVEGIFDLVNLFDKGLTNAICCFGTRNVDKEKLSILKMQNIVGLDIIFDGDEAGQTAAEDIKTMGEALGMLVRNIDLGNGIDPGSLAQTQVNKLRERLYNESSTN